MLLDDRVLNRTLWLRQGLVPSAPLGPDPLAAVAHLVGLQAQDNLPPYLALAARVPGFDPHDLSAGLEDRRLVRLLTMRGTIHVLTAADALTLRPWVQPMFDQVSRTNQQSRAARDVPSEVLLAACREALADGPLPFAELGARVAARVPGVPEAALRQAVRERVALLQVPPRGLWKRSGCPVLELVETWLGAPLAEPDVPEVVRRYLRAFGPARAADVTAWSRVTRLGPVLAGMADLVRHTDARGRTLYDVPDAPVAEADLPVPVRLLGAYDNLFLSHAERDRIAEPEARERLAGPNGMIGATLFVDGMLSGTWRVGDGGIEVTPFRRLTRDERDGLEVERERVATFLARD